MTLSDLSIKRPVFAWMLMLALIVFGAVGFSRLGVSQLPDIDFPIISVSTTLEGAAPEIIESQVSDVLEDAVMSIEGVKEVSSVSRQGQSSLTIEFELNKDIDIALQDVQSKIAQAQRNLPQNIDPPVVSKTNPEDQPIMWVALSGTQPLKAMMQYAKDTLKDSLTTVPGVGEVNLGGYVEPNVRVWVDQNRLTQTELTVQDVIFAIQSQHQETPAGAIENSRQEMNVRVMGEVSSITGLSQLVFPSRGNTPIWKPFTLSDVAVVEDGLMDVRRISRSGMQTAIGFGIKKQRGVNAVEVSKAVKEKLKKIQSTLPSGMQVNVVFDSTRFIEESNHELNFTLVLSAVLTALVCWAFIGSLSSAFNIVLAIPTSILGTFVFLYFFGFTLNTFTLLGLSLVIGIVVDDAIMVLENIVRHREMGEGKVKAAIIGAREITFAALAASVAILAIFVPVIFMKGIIGKFFFQFGVTISVAVALSLLEALTLAPMRCAQFLEVEHTSRFGKGMDRVMEALSSGYRRILAFCLRWRWSVIAVSLIFLIGSFMTVKALKKEFVPSQDQSRFLVRIQTPLGSSLTYTDAVFKQAETWTVKHPVIERYFSAVGGFGGGEVNTGVIFITLKALDKRPKGPDGKPISQAQMMKEVRKVFKKIPGVVKVGVQDLSLSGFSAQRGYPVEFSIRGPDFKVLGQLSEQLKVQLESSGLMTDVDSDYQLGMPEIHVIPDREKARSRGVNVATIAQTVEALVGGVRVGKYSKDGKRYDIRVRLKPEQRALPEQISTLWVRNQQGELIRLSEVVRIEKVPTLKAITRKNRARAIGMFANVSPGKSQAEALEYVKRITKSSLPSGYQIVFSGSAQTYKESFQSLIFALVLGILVAYMVLAAQFNSFIHPVTVLLALPFSISGAFLALWISNQSLNIYSLIGILLLMGLVKKNSILLVEFTTVKRRQGLSVKEAVLSACPIRLRPIIMTSVATIAAAIPPALALGPGAETRIPMAMVIIGGVTVSTVLTLFVVPCAYSLFSTLERTQRQEEIEETFKELREI
jgi:hydrophobe/amphiphile efflux-1 (HAE1) family protein